jgi:hypothetical protein
MRRVVTIISLFLSTALFMVMISWECFAGDKTHEEDFIKATLIRKYDVIKVSGALLKRFEGCPIERLSLLSFRRGDISPIPFQIDERDPEGHYVMKSGKTAGRDEDSGRLDANDELVFMVWDAGDHLLEDKRVSDRDLIEIEMTDPRYTDRHAWVYLARYDRAAPRSDIDYIHYDPSSERFISDNAIIGYQKGLGFMFYHDLIYPECAGGSGEDFIDRIKFRFKVDLFGGKVALERDEECFSADVLGWVDGPVRVLHSTSNHIRLFEHLPSISFDNIAEYYPHMMTTPLIIRFPFNLNLIIKFLGIRVFKVDIMGDLSGMIGGKAYTSLGMNGYTYSGCATEEDLEAIERDGVVWGLATREGVGTWFPRVLFPDVHNQFNHLYFTDNLEMQNPPDNVPGEIGNGLTLDIAEYPSEILDWLGTGRFVLRLDTYYAPPGMNPGDAREWFDILDYPLFIDAHGGRAELKRTWDNSAAPGPPWEGGSDGLITDTRGRKTCLKGMAYFVGSPESSPRTSFLGERVEDETFHDIPLSMIQSLENHYVNYEPVTRTHNALFTEFILRDGSRLDLLGCKTCGYAGADEQGRVIYLSNSQIKRIDFQPCGH